MKKLYNTKFLPFLAGILLVNAGTICQYINPFSDFVNGVTKGTGIVFLIWFITAACCKSVADQTPNA